ncbi:MAG: anti-sigma factor family protein [Pirellulaceae bacterium]
MNCDELLTALNSFVDGEVDAAFCRDFEKHLSGCHPCQVVVDNVRQTITLYRDGEPYPLPAEFHRRLRRQLRSKWQEKFGS